MKILIIYGFLLFSISFCVGQKKDIIVKGLIENYSNQSVYLYKCVVNFESGSDTILLCDSTYTNKNGEFAFSGNVMNSEIGIYKAMLHNNQFFYLIYDKQPVEIKTLYQASTFYNIVSDSLIVIKSEENKQFYKFQQLQKSINVANYWLMQMMRLYPLHDPFHQEIENEFFNRYNAMEQFIKTLNTKHEVFNESLAAKVAFAYYQPVLPDWKQSDPWRDSIISMHYFEYFNPADNFYLHTNILPEKIDKLLSLSLDNTPTSLETPHQKEEKVKHAAEEWLRQVKPNQKTFEWSLNYLFKTLEKQKYFDAMYYLYDIYVQNQLGECEPYAAYKHMHEKMSLLKNIQIGSAAPDFVILDGKLNLYQLPGDYTLILFWATWCPHCTQVLPEIKKATAELNLNLFTVAVSLDTDKEKWQNFVNENNLLSFINYSEYKGWQSAVVKTYNVYATPTMFLLDNNKKIIAKPETVKQLVNTLTIENNIKKF